MQIWIIRASFTLLSAVFGFITNSWNGGITVLIIAIILVGIESSIRRALMRDVFACLAGLTFGLIVAGLIIYIISHATEVKNATLTMSIALLFSYTGMMIFYRRRETFGLFSLAASGFSATSRGFKILDTSVIIDGRIREICQTGFIEGRLMIPQFVLNELQHIADSTDQLRRNKGRRGFTVLRMMQNDPDIEVEVTEDDFPDVAEVDAKLVQLAQKLDAQIITNDFNLNEVAELQGVTVLNVNELAHAVRSVVVGGEVIQVRLLREGKEPNQGVGYLDDGTMVIVEGGRGYVGQTLDVVVTQTLRTSAGQMIFTRRKDDEVDSNESEDMRSYPRSWQRTSNGPSY